jgi:hypothetical protein
MPSLSEAIRIATFSLTRDRRRQSNQRRVPEEVLAEAARRLARVRRLDRARDFEELLAMVTKTCWNIRGFGTCTRYDVAFRIGLYLKKLPRRVYLHAGSRGGAKALGLPHTRDFLEMSILPTELRRLEPWQVEEFLCIYKEWLHPGMVRASP